MNRRDLFTAAMKAGNYKRLDWIYSVFCLTKDADQADEDYLYRIQADPSGYFFRDEKGELQRIEDAPAGQPIYLLKESIVVTSVDIPNAIQEYETTYGNLLTNYILLVEPFGAKLSFMPDKMNIPQIEKIILPKLMDDVDEKDRKAESIYVSEYLKFAESCFFLTGLSQVCVWAATEKNMLPPDGLKEFKAKMFEEFKGRLSEPEVIAEMDARVVAFDKAWRADDPGNNFLLGKKAVNIVRKKKFLMHGGEANVGNGSKMTLIPNSLEEGWDVNAFPAMNNSLRMGSYARGAETMLGGVEVKWMLRASSNIVVTQDDCGSNLGVPKLITENNKHTLVGFSVVSKQGSILVDTPEAAGSYLGKQLMVRSPMYCKLTRTEFCKVCIGKRLSDTPFGLSSAVSAYGSAFLSLFMGATHGKVLEVKKMDYKLQLL